MMEALVNHRAMSEAEVSVDFVGEEEVQDHEEFANRLFAEAHLYLKHVGRKRTGWGVLSDNDEEYEIECARPGGAFRNSNVLVTRSIETVDIDAHQLFNYLTEGKGKSLLYPHKAEEVRTLETVEFGPSSKAETRLFRREMDFPSGTSREFLTLATHDPEMLTYCAKSVLHPAVGGGRGSRHAPGGAAGAPGGLASLFTCRRAAEGTRGIWSLAIQLEDMTVIRGRRHSHITTGEGSTNLKILLFQDLDNPFLFNNIKDLKEFHHSLYRGVKQAIEEGDSF